MSVINGSLCADIVKYHKPEYHSHLAVIIIDEKGSKWASESLENCIIRKENQKQILSFCKDLGCRTIVIHEHDESRPKHIYSVIGEPDFSCVKKQAAVLRGSTSPPLLPFLSENKITSIVLMGGHRDLCVRASLIGYCSDGGYVFKSKCSGIINHGITVLSSPSLLGSYTPEKYKVESKFRLSATSFKNEDFDDIYSKDWPYFTLHQGVRLYTELGVSSFAASFDSPLKQVERNRKIHDGSADFVNEAEISNTDSLSTCTKNTTEINHS